jgi:hypothetical protein
MTSVLERLDDIETVLKGLPVPEYVGVAFFAKKIGLSDSQVRKAYWLQPNYGVSDVPGRLLWSFKTVRTWLDEMTPAQRQAQWERLAPSVKASIKARRES